MPSLLLLLSSLAIGGAVFFLVRLIEPLWDRVSDRYVRDVRPMLDALSLSDARMPQLMRWWGVGMAAIFVFFSVGLGMWPVAFIAVYLAYVAPRLYLHFLINRRAKLLRDQLIGSVTALANASRAGLSLAQGIDNVSAETPEPLATELRRIVRDYRGGRPLAGALVEARDRLKLDGFTLFVSALLVSLERGGKITEALERISRSLQENQRLERKMEADTESGRKVVVMLAAFPAVFLGLFYFLNPEGTALLFTTILGQVTLVFVIGIVYAAVRWANNILTLDV
ncbi:MAG: type II secretion system F family protein [Planctomycetaceae bacterium]|nr:type II secretion system F family protein [Planctomycetaceae bacterium]